MRHRRLQQKPGQYVNPSHVPDRRENPRFEQAYEGLRGIPNLKEIRDAERGKYVEQFQPGCEISNPYHSPPIDKKTPLPGDVKQINLGFQPAPDRIIDLPIGDAGAGRSNFRRAQVFAAATSLDIDIGPASPIVQYREAAVLATARSSDTRARFWHVSCFGTGVQRPIEEGDAALPLTDSEIKTRGQLVGIRGGTLPSQNIPFVPGIASVKCRAQIFDESGGRLYDFDVIGTRSFDLYAYGVTVFLLLPNTPNARIVDPTVRTQTPIPGPAIVTDQLVSSRIIPVQGVSGENGEQLTIPVRVSSQGIVSVPIPPGSYQVQIYSATPGAVPGKLDYQISFDLGQDPAIPIAVATNIGNIILDPAIERTSDLLTIPGQATHITFTPGNDAVNANFVVIYKITV